MTFSSADLVGEARICAVGRCDVCSDSVWVSKPTEFSEHTQANKQKEFRSTDRNVLLILVKFVLLLVNGNTKI
jgi:hypothetical protein